MRVRVVVLAIAALFLSACGEEVLDFIGDSIDSNWSLSSDKYVNAAGESRERVVDERTARMELDEAIENGDADAVEQLAGDRDRDAKLATYVAVMNDARGRSSQADTARTLQLLREQHPNEDELQIRRRAMELVINAIGDVLTKNPDIEGAGKLHRDYCLGVFTEYPRFTEMAPQDVAFFLSFHAGSALAQQC